MPQITRENYAELIRVYSQIAPAYERRFSCYLDKSHRLGIEALAPQPGERILDAGCGTGVAVWKILERLGGKGEVTGVDVTGPMLRIAESKLNGQPGVRFLESPIEELPFQDGFFDGVACFNVVSYLRDPEVALKELRRVLRSDGRLVVVDLCSDHPLNWLCEVMRWFRDPAAFKTYTINELETMLERCGFGILQRQWWDASRTCRFMVVKAVPKEGAGAWIKTSS